MEQSSEGGKGWGRRSTDNTHKPHTNTRARTHLPVGHVVGPLEPSGQKEPAAHVFCVDDVDPEPHHDPAAHGPEQAADDRPVDDPNDPTGHAVADDAPAPQ